MAISACPCLKILGRNMAEVFDSGTVRVAVPEGWSAFLGCDSEGRETPKKVLVYKNVNAPLEIFSKVGITVCYFGRDEYYFSPKPFYDNVCDFEPVEIGNRRWQGYTCTSLGYPYVMLESHVDGTVFQVMVLLENGEEKISLTDGNVRDIIGSISESGT